MIQPTSVHAIATGATGTGKSLLLYWLEQLLLEIGVDRVQSTELEIEKRGRDFTDVPKWELDSLQNKTIVLQEHMINLRFGSRQVVLRPSLPSELETADHVYLSIAGPVNSGKTLIINRMRMLLAEKGITRVELRELFPDESSKRDFNRVGDATLETINCFTWYLNETSAPVREVVPEPEGKFRHKNK